MKSNHIIVIDDDEEDCELFKDACTQLKIKNEIIIFNRSDLVLDYLSTMNKQPMFIICDVNMPLINGLELRQKINKNEKLRFMAIPFLFWSTSGSEALIKQAYSLNIQGFFKKPDSMEELKKIITAIMIYWDYSYHPIH